MAIQLNDDVVVDQTQIIGTDRVVWKAWKRCDKPSGAWPRGYGFSTITYLNGVAHGRMGTERFDCPPAPEEYRRAGRTDTWRWEQLIEHKVRCSRAAHFAILRAMSKTALAERPTFDDNGTIETRA